MVLIALGRKRSFYVLVLGRCGDVHLCCQMTEKSLDFICAHFLLMTNAMKTDVALDPINVSLLGAGAVTVQSHGCSHLVEQFGRFRAGRSRACHLAAFLADLPSRGQEIDCKLQSISR